MTHNAYTQVSSEMGLIGFFFFIGVFISCFRDLLRLDKTARRLQLKEVRSMMLCILLGLVALSIQYFFDFLEAGGSLLIIARQRCASSSAILKFCSVLEAKSTM